MVNIVLRLFRKLHRVEGSFVQEKDLSGFLIVACIGSARVYRTASYKINFELIVPVPRSTSVKKIAALIEGARVREGVIPAGNQLHLVFGEL